MATNSDDLGQRLDILIRLIALQIASDRSVTDGARALKLAGLDNKNIAKVLNTTEATVRTLTTGRRGQPKPKRRSRRG